MTNRLGLYLKEISPRTWIKPKIKHKLRPSTIKPFQQEINKP
jgi:hypothetical protein